MAANEVAKISVGIEAKIDNLAKDLQKAEQTVRKGSKNIEQTVERTSQKIERSWTEAFAKMGFIQQVASIAMQSFKALEGVVKSLGDESLNSSQKITGSLDAIEQAGIPVLSQFLAMGRGIHEMITGEAALEAQITRTNAQYAKRAQEKVSESNARREISKDIASQREAQQDYNELQAQSTEESKLQMQQQREIEALRESLLVKLATMEKGMTDERIAREKENIDELLRLKQDQYDKELQAARERDDAQRQSKQEQLDKEVEAARKAEEAKAKAAEDAAKKVADKTNDLQFHVRQAELKRQGEVEQAAVEAIERRFEKMREGATEQQVKLIDRLEGFEIAAAAEGRLEKVTGKAERQETSATSTLATAIGGFTVATGTSPELREGKKQTTLLEEIVENTAPKQGGAVIIAAA